MDTMLENISALPPLLQFIVIMGWLIIPSALGYLGRRSAAETKEHLTAIEHQRNNEREQHQRDMRELRNEWEREKAQNEQHRSLSNILQITIEKNSETQLTVAAAIRELTGTQRDIERSNTTLKDVLETLSLQLGNVDATSKRTEHTVIEKTTLTLQSVEALVRNNEMMKAAVETLTRRIEEMSEVQDGHIEAQATRHNESRKEVKEGFKSIVEALHTVQKVLETNNVMLQQSQAPTPPQPVTDGNTASNEDTLKSA